MKIYFDLFDDSNLRITCALFSLFHHMVKDWELTYFEWKRLRKIKIFFHEETFYLPQLNAFPFQEKPNGLTCFRKALIPVVKTFINVNCSIKQWLGNRRPRGWKWLLAKKSCILHRPLSTQLTLLITKGTECH